MLCDIVVGTSFGDEGKGKVVHSLLKKEHYDLCVRFNGSGNAGHTVYVNDDKIVLHQLPIGILEQNTKCLICSDCVLDIAKLSEELKMLQEHDIITQGKLMVSKATHIISKDCIEYDKQNNKIGTTGSGVGPTYSLKMLRTGKRAQDFKEELALLDVQVVDMRHFWQQNAFEKVLLEGAQGFELDINWTDNYPYCTSSTCTVAGAINTGIQIKSIRNIYGVAKAYDTYVGAMDWQPRGDSVLEQIAIEGKEVGATTGRGRQCNYLNLDNLAISLFVNNCNVVVINKYAVLCKVDVFKLYHKGTLVTFDNWKKMQQYILSVLHDYKVFFSCSPLSAFDEE